MIVLREFFRSFVRLRCCEDVHPLLIGELSQTLRIHWTLSGIAGGKRRAGLASVNHEDDVGSVDFFGDEAKFEIVDRAGQGLRAFLIARGGAGNEILDDKIETLAFFSRRRAVTREVNEN